jgi:hypothetical protein
MKAIDILYESKNIVVEQHFKQANLLVESVCLDLTKDQRQVVEGIYKDLRPLIEASLTPDQINKIFTDVEASAGNRSMLGKGVDTAKKANDVINNVGKWLQNTTPVKAFDQKFDDLKRQINTKFPDSKILDGISMMGVWAKENPGKTAAIIGVLTAIASLAGGPVGGAIAGQILRGSLELLKGEKLSTALGKGLKTAAIGFLAGKSFELIGDAVAKGADLVRSTIPGAQKLTMMRDATGLGFNSVEVVGRPEDLKPLKDAWDAAGEAWERGDLDLAAKLIVQVKQEAATFSNPEYIAQLTQDAEARKAIADTARTALNIIDGIGVAAQGAASGATAFDKSGKPVKKESRDLTNNQITTIFEWCDGAESVLNEGPMDLLRKAGKKLTTKVTADKLNKLWTKAGSPTDSAAVAKVLRDAGVSDEVLAPIFKSMKIKLPPVEKTAANPDQTAQPTTTASVDSGTAMSYKELQSAVAQLRTRDAQSLLKFIDSIDKPVASKTTVKPAAQPAQTTAQPATATPAAPIPKKASNIKVTGKKSPPKPKVAVAV